MGIYQRFSIVLAAVPLAREKIRMFREKGVGWNGMGRQVDVD